MSEHTGARFFAGAFGDFARDQVADSTQSKFTAFHVAFHLLSVFWFRTFGNDDRRTEMASRVALLDGVGNPVVIERDFRDQNYVGAAGDAAMQRDPSRVPAHHFHDHHALVTRGRRVQPVESIHHGCDGGVESEGHGCSFEIVVDRFRYADTINTGFLQLERSHHRAVAANDDERFDVEFIENVSRLLDDIGRNHSAIARANLGDEMSAICRANDGAAERHDSIRALAIEDDMIAGRQKSFKPVAKAYDFPPEFFRRQDDSAQHSIQPGTITAARKNADARLRLLHGDNQSTFCESTSRPPTTHESSSCPPRLTRPRPSPNRLVLPRRTMMRCRG